MKSASAVVDEFGPEKAFALLTGEPFYICPSIFAKLTDYQVALMITAAVERTKAMRKRMGGEKKIRVPRTKAWNRDEPMPISREVFVAQGVRYFHGDAEAIGKQWDQMNAEWEEMRAKRRGKDGNS